MVGLCAHLRVQMSALELPNQGGALRCPWRKTCQFAKLAHKSAGDFFTFPNQPLFTY
jgi:hypothetical protein